MEWNGVEWNKMELARASKAEQGEEGSICFVYCIVIGSDCI